MKKAVLEVYCTDKLAHPISGFQVEIDVSGSNYKGKTNESGMIRVSFTDAEEPNAKNIQLYIYVDSTKTKKAIGQSFNVVWGKKQILYARSDWVMVKFPLVPNTYSSSNETQLTKESEGFYEVNYAIGKPNEETGFSTAQVYLNKMPKKIIDTALKYRGSTIWAKGVSKTSSNSNETVTVPGGAWKCSLFVNDVLTEVGIAPPWMERGLGMYVPLYQGKYGPPVAADWANANLLKARWAVAGSPKPGDIGSYKANYADASGHTGFVLVPGVTISAGEKKILVNDAGFRATDEHRFDVFRRHKSIK